jgi:2-dehydro-3-deoxygluconokinase
LKYDLIGLGETMLALAPPPGESIAAARTLVVDHAGAESNTCVGLARLGFRVAWVSRLGEDSAGERILAALRCEGVDTRFVRRDPQRPTGIMLKDAGGVRYYRSESAASRLSPDDVAGAPIPAARAVLVTGVTAQIGESPQRAALACLRAARGLRVVDPNFRRGLWGSDRRSELVLPLIEACDLLLAGEAELSELFGTGAPVELARRAAERGPREVVVRGDARVLALERGHGSTELDARRGDALDPIGAGDAFNAGYLAVRLRGGAALDALRAGARCGAAVASQLGDTAGFPRDLGE